MTSEYKPRRGRGEGSVTELRARGLWMGRVTVRPGQRVTVYGVNKSDALAKMRAVATGAEKGQPLPDRRISTGRFLTEWLEGSARTRLRGSTLHAYQHYTEKHLIPGLGRYRLVDLAPEDVDRFLAAKLATGLSPQTVAHMRAVLRAALSWGVKRGRLVRNVAALSDAPRVEPKRLTPLTAEEARRLVEAARVDPWGALYVLALDTGLRQGELIGLRWQDLDLGSRQLRVVQVRERVNGPARFGPPKSASSRRTVTFTATTEGLLREHKGRQNATRLKSGKEWQDLDLVFTRALGKPVDPTAVSRRFHAFLESNRLPARRFHDLRHDSASFLMAEGEPLKAIAERLGHSSTALVLKTYGHLSSELQNQAAEKMDAILRRAL